MLVPPTLFAVCASVSSVTTPLQLSGLSIVCSVFSALRPFDAENVVDAFLRTHVVHSLPPDVIRPQVLSQILYQISHYHPSYPSSLFPS